MKYDERKETYSTKPGDHRDPFDVDYSRVVHSASFRRLQGKTQVLNLGDSDFYRTRLTHSLEVAQIAVGIATNVQADPSARLQGILPSQNLMQAICFSHDLGHPPFGHGGEVALNYCMKDAGGYEGNAQTLRILARLENNTKYSGANLTRRTLLGILKYPAPYSQVRNPAILPDLVKPSDTLRLINRELSKPPKCYYDTEAELVSWLLQSVSDKEIESFCSSESKPGKHAKTKFKSFDCSIMDVADDIAYGVHDLEDVVTLKLVSSEDFYSSTRVEAESDFISWLVKMDSEEFASEAFEKFVDLLFSRDGNVRKRQISRLVNYFMTNIEVTEQNFTEPLLKYRVGIKPQASHFLGALQRFVVENVIWTARVQQLEFKGQLMVVSVFEAMMSDPDKLLPREERPAFHKNGPRAVADYIAGMTDDYLLKTYERLFSPRMGSIFDRL